MKVQSAMEIRKKNLGGQNANFLIFELYFFFELMGKRPQAELKILQLELWLEPARLGLITNVLSQSTPFLYCNKGYGLTQF